MIDPTFLPTAFGSNVVLLGAAGAVAGSVWSLLRSLPNRGWTLVRGRMYLECVVDNEDTVYQWLARWLALRPEMARTGNLRAITVHDGSNDAEFRLVPGDGEHVVRYKGCRIWITANSSESSSAMGTQRLRSFRVRCLSRHRGLVLELLAEIAAMQQRPSRNVTQYFVPDGWSWTMYRQRPIRTGDSVVLADGLLATLLADVRRFDADQSRYHALGIPHRRGYLLSGPPGNGKTSLAEALAGATDRHVYLLPLGDAGMSDERLLRLMLGIPTNAVVVAEDIDTVFAGRTREAENKLTLSGLLNAIDGPAAGEGRILIMTSNHPEKLDPALIRPGRADRHVTLQNATPEQARALFIRFYPSVDRSTASRFAAWAGSGRFSMAALQTHLLAHFDDPDGAAAARLRAA